MRKMILVGAVIAAVIAVGSAVALAQQPSDAGPDTPGPADRGWGKMHGWMSDNLDEMPMHGGHGDVGPDDWQEMHRQMEGSTFDGLDEMATHCGGIDGRFDPPAIGRPDRRPVGGWNA